MTMLDEDRLDEAAKQVRLVLESDRLTDEEREWLLDSILQIEATASAIETDRDDDEDAEVIR